ncbi:stereocilin [Amphiprion ocellaris]|uniref:Uncharacterized protein n=1 Tax=Amphiprion ocellaris TaxID=80972 RepID=A0AAQ5Y7E2_AMPOC|nr:stereocilin [Amphiprion ocellaris]
MAPKGGPCFLLLIIICAALAMRPDGMPGSKGLFKAVTKKLMMNCKNKGVPAPDTKLLNEIFKNSDAPNEDMNSDQHKILKSLFLHVLDSVTGGRNTNEGSPRPPPADVEKMDKMWIFKNLPLLAKRMRDSSDPSICYPRAFMAPAAWLVLTTQGENNIDVDDYDAVKWAAAPIFEQREVELPSKADGEKLKKMMNMFREVYDLMSEDQKTQVLNWEKEQIVGNYFNCTLKPPSKPRSTPISQCKPSLQWLDSDAMNMMGPFLSNLRPADVDSSPKEMMCQFFRSSRFNSTMDKANMKRSLIKKFLGKFKECFKGEDSLKHMDKLGPLACYFYDVQNLTFEDSRKALAQLEKCDNPQIKKVKKRLVNFLMSNSTIAQSRPDFLNKSITLLSTKQLSKIPTEKLTEVVKKLGRTVKWTRKQMRILVKKQMDGKKCKDLSTEDLKALKPIAEGLPRCVLKKMKAKDILDDTAGLKNATQRMKKGKLKAMLEGMENMTVSDLVKKLPGALLRCISLNKLKNADDSSLDKVDNEGWNKAQAAYLVKKMPAWKFRKMRSLIQGITCKIIDEVADREVQDMAQGITENQKWVSKVQAKCAAQKLFASLEKERKDYFKTISDEELDRIDTFLLLHLPPNKVKDLPDSVCSAFIDKMEMANLSKVPFRSPSRPALTMRALRCLAQGKDLSKLTVANVTKLGPLLCELPPSKLELMAPDVLNFSLMTIASCKRIPQRNRKELMELVVKTFGKPRDWSAETVESLLPLLDDDAIAALPNKTDVKDVVSFMTFRLPDIPKGLRKKSFQLATSSTSNAARRKRAVNSVQEPTEALIEELGMNNIFWTPEQLGKMSKDTFLATVETLGEIPDFSDRQLAELSKKAQEAMGPVSQMTEDNIMELGCIIRNFSNSDLEKLPLSLDSVEDLTQCGWTESQMESVWRAVAKYDNLTAQQLDTADIVTLNRFICGLNSDEIKQLSVDAFMDAVGSMDDVQCPYTALEKFKPLIVPARRDPSTWTEADVSELGNFMAGLNREELASLDPPVFSFFTKTSIPLIPPKNMAKLSAAQLESLGPDNAAMITDRQRAALSDEQRDALDRAETGSDEEPSNTTVMSGAPSLSIEGISAFVKPTLVLLMGFLLL